MSQLRPEQGVYVVEDHKIWVATVLQCNPQLKHPAIAVRLCGESKKLVCHTDQVFSNRKEALRWLKSQK